jgi:hypothetical protein
VQTEFANAANVMEDAKNIASEIALENQAARDAAELEQRQAHENNLSTIKQVAEDKRTGLEKWYGNKRLEYEALNDKEKIANFQSTMGIISSLSASGSKLLGGIGKAAGIAQATVSTYQAANMALASPPGPPWSFAYVGAVIAAGLANVARIAGVQMAEGGIVMPSIGGTRATIAEAGRAEAVIPLDPDKLAEFGLGNGGGGKLEIIFKPDNFIEWIEMKLVERSNLNISVQGA